MPLKTYDKLLPMTFNYWLDPKGMLHDAGTGIGNHNEWAKRHLIEQNGEDWWWDFVGSDDYISPYRKLHQMGWVRIKINNDWEQAVQILGDGISLERPMRNTIDPAMNSIQLHIAKMICEEENFDFHKAINDKRFW